METNKQRKLLIEIIDYLMQKTGLRQIDIAKKIGYRQKNALAQVISRETGHEAAIRRLYKEFLNDLKDVEFKNATPEDSTGKGDDTTATLRRRPGKQNIDDTVSGPMEAIIKIASANEKLADSNQRLTIMLEQERSTVNAPAQIAGVSGAIFHNLRELLVDVATGKKYHSEQEVRALLNKVDSAPVKKVSVAGTRSN